MESNVIDVLMYLFEHYLYEDTELKPDHDALRIELEESGFRRKEIAQALEWLTTLEARRTQSVGAHSPRALRIYTREELERLDDNCRGFLLALEQNGVLGAQTRELVIDRVMALGDEVGIEQLKWVILLVLFGQPGQEAAFAWIHDLVYETMGGHLH